MYSKVLEGLSNKVAEQWVPNLQTPVFVFWLGGLTAYLYHYGWATLKDWVLQQPQSVQFALAIVSLILMITSSAIVKKCDQAMLRFLEGYWPHWLNILRQTRIQHYLDQWECKQERWNELCGKAEKDLTAAELDEFAQLDWLIVHSPAQKNQFMPTRLGNLLRASELRSKDRYGLDAVVCWPRLWLLLPESTQKELQDARGALNNAVQLCLWSLLFLLWTPLTLWIPILALPALWLSYRMVLDVAAIYVDLLEATFDVHRNLLYQALRLKLPTNPAQEIQEGETLTQYLWRGSVIQMSEFQN